MVEFDNKEFGERIKNYRIKAELSQENLAQILGKNQSTIVRYEKGQILPDARDIYLICKELNIYESDLFGTDVNRAMQESTYSNPFETDKLYLYFNAYNFRTKKFAPDKFIIELEQKQNICKARIIDYHDGRIYEEGFIKGNSEIVFMVFENYKPTTSRVDVGVIEVNICNGVKGLMLGGYFGTNAKCEPSLRKCYLSKKDIDFTKEMIEKLKLDENEREIIDKQSAMYLDIFNN